MRRLHRAGGRPPYDSCLVLVAELDGKHVLTVEGLARDGRLHPLQEAFLEVGLSSVATARRGCSFLASRC